MCCVCARMSMLPQVQLFWDFASLRHVTRDMFCVFYMYLLHCVARTCLTPASFTHASFTHASFTHASLTHASSSVRLAWNGSSSDTPDLDLVALVFDKFGFVLECCFWGQRSTNSNALVHSGDARPGVPGCPPPPNGRNEETIVIDIARLPPDQYSVAVCVVSASGQPFAAANGAEVTLTAFPAAFIRPSSAAAVSPAKRRPITPNASQVCLGCRVRSLGCGVLG